MLYSAPRFGPDGGGAARGLLAEPDPRGCSRVAGHSGGRSAECAEAGPPAPKRASILFAVDGRERLADLYTPADGGRAGVVLVPGLTPHGRDDRRIVEFAYTLARANFEVIVPDLPAMRSLRVTARDAEPIADAAHFLDERGRTTPGCRVSFPPGPGGPRPGPGRGRRQGRFFPWRSAATIWPR